MKVTTRRYINSFIEIKVDEVEDTCYNKKQAEELKLNLEEVVKDLEMYIEEAKD